MSAAEPRLDQLVRRRWKVSPLAMLAILLVLTAGAVAAVIGGNGIDGRDALIHRGEPAFNLLYEPSLVEAVEPRGDELARLEARPDGLRARVTVRALPDGGLPFGGLPVYAERHLAALRDELGPLRLRQEGKARIWGAPGYRIEYRARGVQGQDVLLFPDDTGLAGGAVVSFRRAAGRRPRPREREAVGEVRRVVRSFQFGASRR